MDKDKFLDVDSKSYCKAYIIPTCIEKGIWNWDIKISCKNYEDTGYINWDNNLKPKNT